LQTCPASAPPSWTAPARTPAGSPALLPAALVTNPRLAELLARQQPGGTLGGFLERLRQRPQLQQLLAGLARGEE